MKLHANRIEVFQGARTGDWYFRVASVNGRTICTSESYTRRRDALRAARRIAANPPIRVLLILA
jgi:uncharacterized protein YegP (UPF0339 family)